MLRLLDFRTISLTSSVAFIFSVIAMPQAVLQVDRNNAGINVVIRVTESNNAKVAAEVSLQGSGVLDRTGSTNDRGDCFFRQVPPGEYVVVVSIGGRERWRQELVLTSNEGPHSELIQLPAENAVMASQVSAVDLNVPRKTGRKYRAGVLNARNAKWADAEANLREAISECPTYARAFNALGVVLEMQTRHKEAEAAFRKATALDEKFGEAHLNLGHLLIVLKRHSEAAIELQDVLSTDPRNKEAVALLAGTYLAVGDDRAMMRLLDYADARSIPHDPESHFDLAQLLEERDSTQLAVDEYGRYLAEAPSGPRSEDARKHLRSLTIALPTTEVTSDTALRKCQNSQHLKAEKK